MKLVESLLTNNPCYKAGRKIEVKGLVLHSVGCNQPNAKTFINLWNKSTYTRACVHGFVDAKDGTVYQTLPWNYRGWHAGGTANNTHIGVEMCEPDCIKYKTGSTFSCSDYDKAKEMVTRTYHASVELFAMLCKTYNLDPLKDGVIVSHKEAYKKGWASNHGDPEHLWKGLGLSYTMNGFRKDVNACLNTTKEFKVKVDIDDLNIRKGSGTNYEKTGKVTGKGTFTITETQSGKGSTKGWGKLKSGLGWISLDYATRI